jgi:serine protease Do
VDPSGYIITNAHVIAGATDIRIMLNEPVIGAAGESALKPIGQIHRATVVGVDRETDIAVLKIERSELPYLELGDSEALKPGQIVFAFGSPLGLENSVSVGVVSSVARQLRPDDPMIYIQTDAAVNPGNSGGPLVDSSGHIVGINTLILSMSGGSDGLSFAAPSHIVDTIYRQLRRYGHVRRGVIGVRAQTITPMMAAGLRLARNFGVIISDVSPGSPAASVGLQAGDIVLALDDKPMENGRQFDVNVYGKQAGEVVKLQILRGTEILEMFAQVVERQEYGDPFARRIVADESLVRELGVFAVNLVDVASVMPQARWSTGVVVAAQAAGNGRLGGNFEPGDIVYSINRQRINNLTELRAALAGLTDGAPMVLHIERRRELRYLELTADW